MSHDNEDGGIAAEAAEIIAQYQTTRIRGILAFAATSYKR